MSPPNPVPSPPPLTVPTVVAIAPVVVFKVYSTLFESMPYKVPSALKAMRGR